MTLKEKIIKRLNRGLGSRFHWTLNGKLMMLIVVGHNPMVHIHGILLMKEYHLTNMLAVKILQQSALNGNAGL